MTFNGALSPDDSGPKYLAKTLANDYPVEQEKIFLKLELAPIVLKAILEVIATHHPQREQRLANGGFERSRQSQRESPRDSCDYFRNIPIDGGIEMYINSPICFAGNRLRTRWRSICLNLGPKCCPRGPRFY